MSPIEIILLALALSIDACVVSFSCGLKFRANRVKNSFLLAFYTGFFQGLMPILGYFLTGFVKNFVEPYANLIVFLIFTYLGVKFILEAFDKEKDLCINIQSLLLIGIATSIDAFSAGITLSLSGNGIFKPSILIALITFINSIFGYLMGIWLKNAPTKWLEIFSGIVLIALGIKAFC